MHLCVEIAALPANTARYITPSGQTSTQVPHPYKGTYRCADAGILEVGNSLPFSTDSLACFLFASSAGRKPSRESGWTIAKTR